MSDKESNGNCYESTGIIHLRIQIGGQESQESGDGQGSASESVYFVPDDKHCVSHQGKKHAVFLPARSCKSVCSCQATKAKPVKAIVVSVSGQANSVKLCFCETSNAKMNKALLKAAMNGSKVDVKVRRGKSDKNCLVLIGITVPARHADK